MDIRAKRLIALNLLMTLTPLQSPVLGLANVPIEGVPADSQPERSLDDAAGGADLSTVSVPQDFFQESALSSFSENDYNAVTEKERNQILKLMGMAGAALKETAITLMGNGVRKFKTYFYTAGGQPVAIRETLNYSPPRADGIKKDIIWRDTNAGVLDHRLQMGDGTVIVKDTQNAIKQVITHMNTAYEKMRLTVNYKAGILSYATLSILDDDNRAIETAVFEKLSNLETPDKQLIGTYKIPIQGLLTELQLFGILKRYDHPRGLLPGSLTGKYHLTFHDEFLAMNEDMWQYRIDKRLNSAQRKENVRVVDGKLILDLKKEQFDGYNNTAGGLISKQQFKYGYYEASMKVPKELGWHTSVWMMDQWKSPTDIQQFEVDIAEVYKRNTINAGAWDHNLHDSHNSRLAYVPEDDMSAGFHTYGCEYTPEKITFFFDGKPFHSIDPKLFPETEMNIWLTSVANLKYNDYKIAETDTAEFDYVRFFEPV